MNKELMTILDYLLKFFELLAAVSGFVSWRKIKHSYWKWFPVYLLGIVVFECIGLYLARQKLPLVNRNMYHYIVIPGEFFFFFWLFFRQQYIPRIRRTVWTGTVLYILLWIVDTFILSHAAYPGAFWFSSLSYSAGNLILLVLMLQFFIRFTGTDAILSFKRNLLFWVSVGLLLFYLGTFPYFGIRNLMYAQYRETFWIYTYIMMMLNCLMYLSFAIGLLWAKPNSTSSS